MMKKMVFSVILMILTGLVFAAFFSCDTGVKEPGSIIYSGKDDTDKKYTLIVTGYTYEIFINGELISSGNIMKEGNKYILSPKAAGETFEVVVEGKDITKIEGSIPPDDGSEPIEPGEMVSPITAVEGIWEWLTSDDSNEKGVSRITNAQDGTDGAKVPYEYPEADKPKDNDNNPIPGKVFNFTGNTKVDPQKPEGDSTYGVGWPMVGWEAIPDEETLALLKRAYGYSFWVKLNSSTTTNKNTPAKSNKWAYVTQVVESDIPKEEGYEHKHWFGNGNISSGNTGDNAMGASGGDSRINNATPGLEVGRWHKITVYMRGSGINLAQDNWISEGSSNKYNFNPSKAEKIQWQIPVQHNGGIQRNGAPYDQISGSHDFNLDFYGLELLIETE